MNEIYKLYNSRMNQEFLFSKEIFQKKISLIRNENGQVWLKQSEMTLLNEI